MKGMYFFCRLFFILLVIAGCKIDPGDSTVDYDQALIPFDSRWIYPQILNFRPADNQMAEVNPPRFSWAYFPEVVNRKGKQEITFFVFQLSRDSLFNQVNFEVSTSYNFYNALPALDPGTWYWRVKYEGEIPEEGWSDTRSFVINGNTPTWDREMIDNAGEIINQHLHPRFGPPDSDWQQLYHTIKEDELLAGWFDKLKKRADQIMAKEWWQHFPATDKFPAADIHELRSRSNYFADLGNDLATIAWLYRITGESEYKMALEYSLKLAEMPPGGVSSPEWLGGLTKMPTQLVEYLALIYDWFYDDLTGEQRIVLLNAIEWRLQEMFYGQQGRMWYSAIRIRPDGLAVHPSSHAYQNTAWSLPAILATVGDLEVSDQLLELTLNYFTGVTIPEGPDEGYNEGQGYSIEKSNTMLSALLLIDRLMPGLEVGKNPMLGRLGDWFIYMFPPGIDRLSFGDAWQAPGKLKEEECLRKLAFLTRDPVIKQAWMTRENGWKQVFNEPGDRPWWNLMQYIDYSEVNKLPGKAPAPSMALNEAGWAFINSKPITDQEQFNQTIGMILQCRPRGGYSHSYASDNSFVWNAYGETLSAGGGGLFNKDIYSDHSISHNVIMVDGVGQIFPVDTDHPQNPFFGRPLAWYQGDDFTWWAGDATLAYPDSIQLERWHRHVLMVEEQVFLIFDDLAVDATADPATFSWLFKVAPDVDLKVEQGNPVKIAYEINQVKAEVTLFASTGDLKVNHLQGKEGYRNAITGEDLYPEMRATLIDRGQVDPDEIIPMQHHIWVSNQEKAHEFGFLAVLDASTSDGFTRVQKKNNVSLELEFSNGSRKTISFGEDPAADINIDLNRVRQHAAQFPEPVKDILNSKKEHNGKTIIP